MEAIPAFFVKAKEAAQDALHAAQELRAAAEAALDEIDRILAEVRG